MTERIRPCLCALDDAVLRRRMAELIKVLDIQTVVETGIDWGGSTRFFAQMAKHVIGIDNDPVRVQAVRSELFGDGITNLTLLEMNSPDALRWLAGKEFFDASRTLFFLDAHWQAYWPLLDEIACIPRGQGLIVMHDVKVPGCPGLGFDTYGGQDLDYAYVKAALTAWSPGHSLEYNDDTAEGSHRGVLIVYPEAL